MVNHIAEQPASQSYEAGILETQNRPAGLLEQDSVEEEALALCRWEDEGGAIPPAQVDPD